MKILLIGDYPPPAGGVAVHVQQLFESLKALGEAVSVLDIGKGSPIRSSTGYVRALFRHIRRGMVCHLHISGNNTKAWMVALVLCIVARIMGAHLMVTVHSGSFPQFTEHSASRRLLVRLAVAGMGSIVAVSEEIRKGLIECGVPADSVNVVPAFLVDRVVPATAPEAFAQARGRFKTVLSMAHHPSPIYGQQVMIDAFSQLCARHPDWCLVVFGPESQGPAFQQQVAERALTDRVISLGELPHPETLGIIAASDVFVRPTQTDGDAISVREALTLGTRCVASDVVSRPEGTVLFNSGNATHLASQIEYSLLSSAKRFPMPDATSTLLKTYRRCMQ